MPAPLRGRVLWLLLGLYLLVRLLQGLGSVISFDDEEGYTIAAAWELLHNNIWPYQVYQLSDWENGTLITVLVNALLALLLGPSVFTLKATAILTHCLTVVMLYLLCRDAPKSWQEARSFCQSRGGDLLVIESEEENLWIAAQNVSNPWIGINDIDTEGEFV